MDTNKLKARAAADFWKNYEISVDPHQMAAVKSLYTGQPEILTHRNLPGDSDVYKHVIPHIPEHASKVQQAILKDPSIKKRYIGTEPYVQLHRGVGGDYSKKIAEMAEHNPSKNTAAGRMLSLKTAPFSSWSTDRMLAEDFALGRHEIPNQAKHSLVMSKWMPLKHVLHSGFHKVHEGQVHPHKHEKEIVVGHPSGSMDIKTSDISFLHPHTGEYKAPQLKEVSDQNVHTIHPTRHVSAKNHPREVMAKSEIKKT